MSLRGERRGPIAVALVLLALVVFAVSARPAAAEVVYETAPSPFCDGEVVHDYLKPLAALPPLHSLPKAGGVGFGPGGLRIATEPSLVIGGGEVGFAIQNLHRKPALGLDWNVESTFARVSAAGKPIGLGKTRRRKVASLRRGHGLPLKFDVGTKPAIYRVTLGISNASGKTLGRFGAYFRVVRQRLGVVRLETNAPSYRHEQTVFARVANYGTLIASYGVPYAIERLLGGVWSEAPETPHGPTILPLYASNPGSSGRCGSFWIPPTMQPGRYRFVKKVNVGPTFLGRSKPRRLAAEFDVLP